MKIGDSIDMRCANLAVEYEIYLNTKQETGFQDKQDHGYSQEQLQEILQRVKKDGG